MICLHSSSPCQPRTGSLASGKHWRGSVAEAENSKLLSRMNTCALSLVLFRDDIIFVIYLFQRWKYPTDMTRPNEYGQVFDEKKEDGVSISDADDAGEKSSADKKKD